MKINKKQILDETYDVFIKAGFDKILANSVTVGKTEYETLHTSFLVPTSITIETELLREELKPFEFVQWGNNHTNVPRYGLALVNQSGELIDNDPINGSLMAYNKDHPDQLLLETDCKTPTKVMNIKSLEPLSVFNGYWTRSNVFKWNKGAFFVPHIDTIVPSMWLRLWMATEGVVVRQYDETKQELVEVSFEPGRVYLIDTSIIHDAYTDKDEVFQLFLSVMPEASTIVKSLLN